VTDPVSGIIQAVNPAFAAMHGGTVEDFVGRLAQSLLSDEFQQQVPQLLTQIDGKGHLQVEARTRRRIAKVEARFETAFTSAPSGGVSITKRYLRPDAVGAEDVGLVEHQPVRADPSLELANQS
jgi:hypothetical protein